MVKSIKERYSNQTLNDIIHYFMRTVLHLQKSGIEDLPLRNNFEEPIHTYLELAIELMIDGQLPEISDLILNAEYNVILSKVNITSEVALNLNMIKELSQHIHYDNDCFGYLLSTSNLWGNDIFEYASRTFYPNLSDEIKSKYQIHDLIKYVPQELFRLNDY